ncbi:MAG: site-2 protease family protein [Candidatus Sedimenticola sp. (ex Thyasira tokunagai)]
MDIGNTIQQVSVLLLPVLFAITVHEAAHGWMAMKHGDKTALMLGRVTLNPLKHIDPVGTVLVPLVTFFLSGFLFGWAKPVPVNWRNLNNPRRDMAFVALAGPGANLLMAVGWAVIIKLGVVLMSQWQWVGLPLVYMGGAGVLINTLLMVLNLMPILPLDGGRILNSLLPPPRLAYQFSRLEPFGMFIIIGLLMTGVLGKVLWPLVIFTINILPASDIVKEIYF